MKFEEVIPALREGKKVRRAAWSAEAYTFRKEGVIINEEGFVANDIYLHIFHTDWEVVKEKKKYQGWVNLYSTGEGGAVQPSKEAALKFKAQHLDLVETRMIEWEVEE